MATPRQRRGGANVPYQSRMGVQPVYEDFKLESEWLQDGDSYNLIIQVPGFMREQLKVSTEDEKTIRVRGERFVAGNKWSRFQEDFQVPDNCELTSVRAKHDSGTLTITVPRKNIAGETKEEENKASQETLSPSHKAQDQVLPPQTTGMTAFRQPETDQQGRDKVTPTYDKTLERARGFWKKSDDHPRTKIERQEDEQKSYIEKEKRQEMKDKTAPPENIVDEAGKKVVDDKSVELAGINTRTGRQEDEQKSYIEKKGIQETKEKHVIQKAPRKDNVGKGKEITKDHKKIKSEKESKENQIVKTSEADDSPESDHGVFKMELKKHKKKAMTVSELNEERQLMVNMGAALLVIVAISAYVSFNFASQNAK
ncbi:inactive protein RESTRICTED TEV MOVEMENT 2-like [Forsythia ovata]|uniref:Inactive protein RESTRICTED TEV MOVEMENT 2-like n=1 Tax=Forsythia ovata TaxID=205694 RepID=A0ABD1QQS7_9LAMI